MHDRVAAAERRSEESLKEHQRRTREIETQFQEKEQLLQNNLRKQMQRMIDEQCKEIEEIKVDFDHATSLMTEKYNRLTENFNELQELYEGRPSRPEDLEMIRDQNEQIEQKDAFIKKQEDDMKFYKLELINREQSYNQMFGTNPMVGGAFNPAIGGMGAISIGPKP
jgi:arginyl-tRNA synthetase